MNENHKEVMLSYPITPISINRMYRQFKGRTIISAEGRQFKSDMEIMTRAQLFGGEFDGYDEQGFIVKIFFTNAKFWTKDGRIASRGGDLDNLLKALLDSVFKSIGIDDSHIIRLELEKGKSDLPQTIVKLSFKTDSF